MAYAELTNGSVWYEERGQGEPLVLVHGGAVDSRFFEHNIGALAERFRVIPTDLWGHGRTADREGNFSYDSFATDVEELIERVAGGPAHLLGHSIGAVVALTVAMRRPDLVRRLVMVSGGFDRRADAGATDTVSEEQVQQAVAFLGNTYGEVSPDGEEHFAAVVYKDLELGTREPELAPTELGGITARTLVMAADDDITTLEHMIDMYRAIPDSELSIVPGTSHFLLQEKPAACNAILIDFLANDPVPTVAPLRRAPAQPPG